MADLHAETIAHLSAAPYDRARWTPALNGLAQSGGGWAGQLIAASPTRGYVFSVAANVSLDLIVELSIWGTDPETQPRIGVVAAPLLHSVGDYDFLDERARSRTLNRPGFAGGPYS